jgi:hypothetical protein
MTSRSRCSSCLARERLVTGKLLEVDGGVEAPDLDLNLPDL